MFHSSEDEQYDSKCSPYDLREGEGCLTHGEGGM